MPLLQCSELIARRCFLLWSSGSVVVIDDQVTSCSQKASIQHNVFLDLTICINHEAGKRPFLLDHRGYAIERGFFSAMADNQVHTSIDAVGFQVGAKTLD